MTEQPDGVFGERCFCGCGICGVASRHTDREGVERCDICGHALDSESDAYRADREHWKATAEDR